jgi:peptidyl-prolyl cis-trans isomerase C
VIGLSSLIVITVGTAKRGAFFKHGLPDKQQGNHKQIRRPSMSTIFKNSLRIIFLMSFVAASVLPASAEKAASGKKSDAKKPAIVKSEKKAAAANSEKKATTEDSEKKAAIVNGSVITQRSFDQEFTVLRAQIEQSGQKIEDNQTDEFKKHVINQLISAELLYQDSKQKGIKVSDEQLGKYLAEVVKRFPSEEEFKKGLAEMNMTEAEMKMKLRKSLAIQELITKYVALGTEVTDEEAKAFYDMRSELFQQPESVKASHILIKVAADAKQPEKDAAMTKIKEIQDKVKKGEDFAELAKKNSECPSAPNGGDLGFFPKGQMVKPFEDAAFALAPGAVSDIVVTQFGYHLIKAVEKKKSEQIAFETAKEKIKGNLSKDKRKQKVDSHIDMLMAKAKIEKFI